MKRNLYCENCLVATQRPKRWGLVRNPCSQSISSDSERFSSARKSDQLRTQVEDLCLAEFVRGRAVASSEDCFASARRSPFFLRFARRLALSLPLLCPILRNLCRLHQSSTSRILRRLRPFTPRHFPLDTRVSSCPEETPRAFLPAARD